MISFDFEYYQPTTVESAVARFNASHVAGKKVMYYSGGTELISRGRMNEIKPEVVIDLKLIPACRRFEKQAGEIIIGAAMTLTEIVDAQIFPVLAGVAKGIATRTARNKITVGGNMMSNLPYKEAIMPFLLAESELEIAGADGIRRVPIREVFDGAWKLAADEFLVAIYTQEHFAECVFHHDKKTQGSKVNYPILSMASLLVDGKVRVAFSGLCGEPFRCEKIETVLNEFSLSFEERTKKVQIIIPGTVLTDMFAGADYRLFLLGNVLADMFDMTEDVS